MNKNKNTHTKTYQNAKRDMLGNKFMAVNTNLKKEKI